jgi:polyisoprenoid-binding protein YceI
MRRIRNLSLLALVPTTFAAASVATPARAAVWEIDASHADIEFSVRHLAISKVKGQFSKVAGSVNLDERDITKSTVEATIEVNSINTHEPKRDAHLKSPDFFDADKFKTITFKSTKVNKAGKGKLDVEGDLTLHGVTKPVKLKVEGPAKEVKDPWGNVKSAIVATTKLDRKEFGLVWNKTLDGGGLLVGDEVEVTINLELAKKVEAPAAAAAPAKKK